jgi:hypothetical protein
MRTFLTALLAACALLSTAAELRLRGEVTDHETRLPLGEVLVRVYRNGVKEQVFHTGPAGKYNINLERGGEYIIRFSLPDHVTKCYAVDTRGASWEDDTREVSVDVEMTLFEKVPGVDLSFFDMPMGMARFCPMTGLLKWDAGYEERIRPEVDRLMEEVRARREAQPMTAVLQN